MTAPRLLTGALAAGCALVLCACGAAPSSTAAGAGTATTELTVARASAAPTQAAATTSRRAAAAPAPKAPAAAAAQPAATRQRDADAPAAAQDVPLSARVLQPADLGSDWLMAKPDDAKADAAKHQFCGPQFASDAARLQRIERSFAREDGLRVQQEINRYATPADAERAMAEYADTFTRCDEYEPQPGVRIRFTPWTAPAEAADRTGAQMTVQPPGHAVVHATLAAYRTGALVMVVSVVAEQPEPSETWHNQVAPTAVRRAQMAAAPTSQETR